MNSLLYIIAFILIVCWAVSVFFYAVGSFIHVLLIIGVIVLIVKLLGRSRPV